MNLPTELWVLILSYIAIEDLMGIMEKLRKSAKRDPSFNSERDFIKERILTIWFVRQNNNRSVKLCDVLDTFPYANKLIIIKCSGYYVNENWDRPPIFVNEYFTNWNKITYVDISKAGCDIKLSLEHVETLVLSHNASILGPKPKNANIIYAYEGCKTRSPEEPKYLAYLFSTVKTESGLTSAKQYIRSRLTGNKLNRFVDCICMQYCNNKYQIEMLKFLYEVYPIRARSHIIGVTFVNPWYAIELLNKMPIQTDIIKQAILVLNEISLSFTVIRRE